MPLYINTNTLSLNAQTHLAKNTNALKASMEKLASGFRINRAGDDAAGMRPLPPEIRTAARTNPGLVTLPGGQQVGTQAARWPDVHALFCQIWQYF